MTRVSHGIDRVAMVFDDESLVANAGLLLVATLVVRVGLDALVNATVVLAGRVGGAHPGRKILTLVHAMVAGASHIDHADVLHSGSTEAVLGHQVMATSTLGTFLRAFSFGHVRQLEAVIAVTIARAWAAGRDRAPSSWWWISGSPRWSVGLCDGDVWSLGVHH